MAGGTWVTENKVRPGAYINVQTNLITNNVSDRGTVLLPLIRSWGGGEFVKVDADSDFLSLLGYEIDSDELLAVRECLKRAKTVKVWSLGGGNKAAGTLGNLTATAVYGGTRGNDIAVTVASATVGGSTQYTVTTQLDGKTVNKQIVSGISGLTANKFVTFSGSGALSNGTARLTGGTNSTVAESSYNDFFTKAKTESFDVMAVDSNIAGVKSKTLAFIKDLRENEGLAVQAVLADYTTADYQGIISVKNGVILENGSVLDKYKAVYWVAGATAGAAVNRSNTYTVYENSVGVDVKYSNSEIIEALQEGSFVFTATAKGAAVEQDINTLTTFSAEQGSILRKNRVLRVLDTMVNDIRNIFNEYFLGKVNNNADGRNLFKAQILGYLESLQAMAAISDLDKNNDVMVKAGSDADSIVVNLAVMPVDSIEKLYMTVVVG